MAKNKKDNLGKRKISNGFQKGQSGNPKGGIPKFQSFKWFIEKYSIKTIEDIKDINLEKLPIKEALVVKQYIEAYNENDLKVAEWLASRSEGAPKQTIENTGEVGTYKVDPKKYAKMRKETLKDDDV